MAQYTTPFGITSQFPFCGLPLRLDTYRGCSFRCLYCFARNRGGAQAQNNVVVPADPKYIEGVFARAFDSYADSMTLVGAFLRRRVPIHFGGMSDPFQPAERHFRVTSSALRTIQKWDYPVVLSTRGPLVGTEHYLSLLSSLRAVVVQFSFSSTVDEKARQVEPDCTRPTELLRVIETLAIRGINVTVRWQPYIRGISEKAETFVRRVADAGAKHVALEHLKVPVERNSPLWLAMASRTKRDFGKEYRQAQAFRQGRELVLPSATKLRTLLQVREAAHKAGLTFGAADNEFQWLSDTACCCSGVDQFPGFENFFRHQIAYAVRESRGASFTYAKIAKQWSPAGRVDRFLNSRSRFEGGMSIREHVSAHWDDDKSDLNPLSFFGVSRANRTQAGRPIHTWTSEGRALWRLLGKQ